jgi:multicomponent Na+:H+ antiporter subunit D
MVMSASHADAALYVIWLMLLFASAGVLEHSGIKIPYFAFFSHDSGKRPREAPFNMMIAMGLAAAISIGAGLFPAWLYRLLPYPEVAMEYLAQDLWKLPHVLEQLQLLGFATLAFMLLKWLKLYPAERPGVILDAEWIWRKAVPQLARVLSRPAAAPLRLASGMLESAGRGAFGLARQVFARDGAISARLPLAASAFWTLAILGVVLIVSLFS